MSGFESRYGELTVRVFPTSAEMARAAARDAGAVLQRTLDERGEANAMFATGNSQLEMLACLVALADIAWGHVRVFHMDEYIGLADDHQVGRLAVRKVELGEHARQQERRLRSWLEKRTSDPPMRIGHVAERGDVALDAGQVLEV